MPHMPVLPIVPRATLPAGVWARSTLAHCAIGIVTSGAMGKVRLQVQAGERLATQPGGPTGWKTEPPAPVPGPPDTYYPSLLAWIFWVVTGGVTRPL